MASKKTDRAFMEMAVAEMKKSRSEHADKRDPLVGAVLVGRDGKLLAATHRGDLRVGDHAEFTLIERYMRDKNLEGATLYVTLEPCTRRNPPKKPCAEWIAKARIGTVFVGMTDPNPDICGRGITHLQKAGVEVAFFDNDLGSAVRDVNREFIEYWEAQEKKSPESAEPFEGPSDKELEVVARASLGDLSKTALQRYLDECELNVAVPSKELWRRLERGGYVGRTKSGKQVPTVAGIVLFAEKPSEILPQCRVSIEAKKAGRTIPADFDGPLMGFRDHLEGFFKEYMRYFTEVREFERVKVGEYPTEALREAAFNAVVHRDYRAGTRVHITLSESEVEFRNPGGLLKPISLMQMRAFSAPPYSRNPHIALAFQRMRWIDEKGSGLGRMRATMTAHGLRAPFIDLKDGYVVVKLPGQELAWASVRIDQAFLDKLGRLEQQILRVLLAQNRISTHDCVTKIGIGDGTARRHLRRLRDLGIVESSGEGASAHYVLAGQ